MSRCHTEHLEMRPLELPRRDIGPVFRAGDNHGRVLRAGNSFDGGQMLARVEEHRVIETDVVFLIHLLEMMFDDDELLLIAHERQRLDQQRVNGGKDRARQPDAERERQNRNGGKTGRPGQCPPGVPEIPPHMLDCLSGLRHHSCGDSIFDDAAVEQMDGAIGVLRKTRVVRDHADGRAAGVQFLQQIHDRFAVARVEVAGRFVRQKDGRLARERARDRDTLLLAAGKLARQMFGAMSHADAFERFEHEIVFARTPACRDRSTAARRFRKRSGRR